jgi:hypothetical protein
MNSMKHCTTDFATREVAFRFREIAQRLCGAGVRMSPQRALTFFHEKSLVGHKLSNTFARTPK